MEALIENILGYFIVFNIIVIVYYWYLKKHKKRTKLTELKIEKAKEEGLFEPVSLHPVVDPDICIGSGACLEACPEKDILGMVNGKAKTVNASRCVGHGACFHACPVQAITLVIGTEKRGVDLPHVSPEFETNVPGIYIAGELGGMGLIKNAVEQGKQAVQYLIKKLDKKNDDSYDLIIVGAGPAGISASLEAKKNNLKFLTIEQESFGGTVFNFPRSKVVMTSPMDLPLYGKVKLNETSKSQLLALWNDAFQKNNIKINEQEKVEAIEKTENVFEIKTSKNNYSAKKILIAIGRRGSPRKLNVPGEEKEKVAYKLLEPELINNQNVLVVGGGDSAIEAALSLAEGNNKVTVSYRSETFARLKPKNLEKINIAEKNGKVDLIFNSTVKEIKEKTVVLNTQNGVSELENELVFVFAGGELPTAFLEKTGIKITKKFGEAILSHKRK